MKWEEGHISNTKSFGKTGGTEIDYMSFGCGEKALVMLPGLGDALKTVKGTATPVSVI